MDAFSSALAAAALVDGQHFTLPGYGTLEGVYVSARIDHVAREVAPPQLEITWTTPPVTGAQSFAELLVNTGATTAEAVGTQEAWLDALERGDRVEVGDLGYLLLDERTNVPRWNPDAEGLRAAYWSGGAVAVEPLPTDRARVAVEHAPTRAASAGAPVVVHKKPASRGRLLRYAAMFAGVLVAVYLLRSAFGGGVDADEEARAVTISNDRLNRSPLDATTAEAEVLTADFEEPTYDPALGPDDGDALAFRAPDDQPAVPGGRVANDAGFDPADLAGGAPTVADLPGADLPSAGAQAQKQAPAGGREYVVILGSFGRARNAGKLTERLAAAGLVPYVDQPGGLTRVGVAFEAPTPAAAQARLGELRTAYAPDAWLLD